VTHDPRSGSHRSKAYQTRGDNLTSRIAKTSAPSRMANYRDDGSEITRTALSVGTRGSAGAPILVDDSLWGSIIVQSKVGRPLPDDIGSRLSEFTELVALAIASSDARSELTASRARIVVAADAARDDVPPSGGEATLGPM